MMGSGPEPTNSLPGIRLSAHPRATIHVRRTKSAGALLGFVVVGLATRHAGHPFATVILHALIGGVAGYLVTWATALTAWRALMVAEMREARTQAIAMAEQRILELEAAAEAERQRAQQTAADPDAEPAPARAGNRWRGGR